MQRVSRSDVRVVSLEALLRPVEAQAIEVVAAAADPIARLAEERASVLQAAEEQGYAEGIARAEKQIAAAVARAEAAVEQQNAYELDRLQRANARVARLLEHLPVSIQDAEARMEEVALEVAYAAVLRLLDASRADRTLIAALCRQALDDYGQRPSSLQVAPSDADDIAVLAAEANVRVEADPRLAPGQVRLATHKGMYETSLEIRLEQLKQAFLRGVTGAEDNAS